MEYAIVSFETGHLDRLTEIFKHGIMPELDRAGFGLSFDRYSKDGEARLFVFELLKSGFLSTSGYYSASVLFESDKDGRCTVSIVLGGGPRDYSTDGNLRILDSIKNPILRIEEGAITVYDSAWLYDGDDAVRQKAVLALGRVGGDASVDKIIAIMNNDRSDAVHEAAVLSLGHIGGDKAIDPLMKIATKKANLITACARALGEIRSQKALGSLNELLSYCERKDLRAEAKAVRQAIQRAELGDSYKEIMCTVCNQPIEESEEVAQCSFCGKTAHKTHMLEWLHVHGKCPSCGHSLTDSGIVEQSARGHPRQPKPART
jgi:predicted RNA-binding Zn-ribbon protein involved in translation (DUF1610 family)